MKAILSERNLVIILFVLVVIIFSLAQEDSKKMDQFYGGSVSEATKPVVTVFNRPLNKSGTREKDPNIFTKELK
jgi:hypothetical protein